MVSTHVSNIFFFGKIELKVFVKAWFVVNKRRRKYADWNRKSNETILKGKLDRSKSWVLYKIN